MAIDSMNRAWTCGGRMALAPVVWGLWAASALSLATAGDPAADEIRIVQLQGPGATQGKMQVLTPGSVDWVSTTDTNQVLRPGWRVRIGSNTRVTLRWSDQSVVTFKQLTEFEILPPDQPKAQAGLRLFKGIFSFFHRDKPSRIRVLSRGAPAGVEGTEFVMAIETVNNVEQTRLSVIDGTVTFGTGPGTLTLTNLEEAVAVVGQAPRRTPGFIIANNVLQWCLYYPAVLDLRDLPLTPDEEQALADSLTAYRTGDLLAALARYPDGRQPASDPERVYRAALLLSVGEVERTELALAALPAADPSERLPRLANALRQLIAAVKRQERPSTLNPQLSTELLAASYYEQSLAVRETALRSALTLARQAANTSPEFGFAWARVAELEFSFGRTRRALEALNQALTLSPSNAQAIALKGFLLAAQNKTREAIESFNQAIAVDGNLGNAWLGRGLCRIRRGDRQGGREDLLIAAALEPQRAFLRSYLGKAYGDAGDRERAAYELALAKNLDPNDPTAWLYSALLNEQQNRINEGIRELEKSQDLNDSRRLYRSQFLLDEDRAVRGASLARFYQEAGLNDVAVREAGKAVAADYGNFSAHLFLANSYAQLDLGSPFDQRYDTPRFSEYFVARLLGPPEGHLQLLSVNQQEYTRLLERDGLGLFSSTEYLSRGAWHQYAAQFGTFGSSSYALEADYLTDPGETPNRELETRLFSAKIKQMVTERDGLLFDVLHFNQESGDLQKRYDPNDAVAGLHLREKQEPSVLAGWDHRWESDQRTLVLASHFNSALSVASPRGGTILLPDDGTGTVEAVVPVDLTQSYERRLNINSVELQHLARTRSLQTVAGIRFQTATARIDNEQIINFGNAPGLEFYFGPDGTVVTNQSLELRAFRVTPYLYEHWQVFDSLMLIGGLAYDYLSLPRNSLFGPIGDEDETKSRLSPKAALLWTPTRRSSIRAAYARSLGGFDLDQSVRLEPTQLAGFVQGYRNLFPESLVGGISGAPMETADVSLEYQFPTATYAAVSGQLLRSSVEHDVGAFQKDIVASGPGRQISESLRFQERSFEVSIGQLFADYFSAGIRYRVSEARLTRAYPQFDPSICIGCGTSEGVLQLATLYGRFQHPSGFFAGSEAQWWSQDLREQLAGLANDTFWQFNLFAGYRSPHRRLEATIGLLNVTDQDYRLHPINLYAEVPRERTLSVSLKLSF